MGERAGPVSLVCMVVVEVEEGIGRIMEVFLTIPTTITGMSGGRVLVIFAVAAGERALLRPQVSTLPMVVLVGMEFNVFCLELPIFHPLVHYMVRIIGEEGVVEVPTLHRQFSTETGDGVVVGAERV